MTSPSDIPTGWDSGFDAGMTDGTAGAAGDGRAAGTSGAAGAAGGSATALPEGMFAGVLGVPASGLVALFTEQGPQLFAVDDAPRLRSLMGRSVIPRIPFEGRGMREACVHDPANNRLLVSERVSVPGEEPAAEYLEPGDNITAAEAVELPEGGSVWVREHTFHLSEAKPVEENPWNDMEEFFARVPAGAAERGEFVMLEPAGPDQARPMTPDTMPSKFAVFGVFPDAEGVTHPAVEVRPHPTEAQYWKDVPVDPSGTTRVQAESSADPSVQGILALLAASTWGTSPWELLVTYGTIPTPEAMAQARAVMEQRDTAGAAEDAGGNAEDDGGDMESDGGDTEAHQ